MRLSLFLAWCALMIVPMASAEPRLSESSGLAIDSRGVLWSHNDGPNIGDRVADHRIYSLDANGNIVSFVELNARNSDWEDMAAFAYEKKNYLLVADVGDNREKRTESQIYVIEEPVSEKVKVAWKIRFRYPDKPHDCEAVAVDSRKERILLVSKRDPVPQIFSLPLHPDKGIQTAMLLGSMWPLPRSSLWDDVTHPLLGPYTHEPSGLDISRDGRLAVIVTYDDAYLWRRKKGETWEQVLAREPNRILVLPGIRQYEGVAFSRDGRTVYVSEEGDQRITIVDLAE